MARRSYAQYCGLAKALDVLGERWTLLVIRELLLGPRRFSDLLAGLPGIGANVLSARLRTLEESELVRKRRLPAPAASTVYELTERGAALEPAIMDLARWGIDLMGLPSDADAYRPGWLLTGMKAAFKPETAVGVRRAYRLRVDDDVFTVRVDDGQLDVSQGESGDADVEIALDSDALLAISAGQLEPGEAVASGRMRVEGASAEEATALAELFHLPGAALAAA